MLIPSGEAGIGWAPQVIVGPSSPGKKKTLLDPTILKELQTNLTFYFRAKCLSNDPL